MRAVSAPSLEPITVPDTGRCSIVQVSPSLVSPQEDGDTLTDPLSWVRGVNTRAGRHLPCLPGDAAARRPCGLAKKLGFSWPQSPPPHDAGRQGPSPGSSGGEQERAGHAAACLAPSRSCGAGGCVFLRRVEHVVFNSRIP